MLARTASVSWFPTAEFSFVDPFPPAEVPRLSPVARAVAEPQATGMERNVQELRELERVRRAG